MTSLWNSEVKRLAAMAGVEWFSHQETCFTWVAQHSQGFDRMRLCLYYKTGAGKSITALACMALTEQKHVLVIAPPSTHDAWVEQGMQLDIRVTAVSHAKFRQPGFKIARDTAIIADEFHLFGGHSGKGWKKFDRMARGLQAPLILASATPNYNDAERVYCIQHVLSPNTVKGGYLEFLYQHCNTVQDPFSQTPNVDKEWPFKHFKDAASYLASLPEVMYLPDTLTYTIEDTPVKKKIPPELRRLGYNPRRRRMIASQIEERHTIVDLTYLSDDGFLGNVHIRSWIRSRVDGAEGSVLIFSEHSSVAKGVSRLLTAMNREHAYVDGKSSAKLKQQELDRFRSGNVDVLVGTASLATGTDGLDKVCDTLLIVDDTQDNALRRQLIGRIMPRGKDDDASAKTVHRLILED